jgi:hypothetical protein
MILVPAGSRTTLEFTRTETIALSAALALIVAVVFGQSALLPFIQDDWGLLRVFQSHDSFAALRSFFNYSAVLYRPLGETYLLGMYRLFGASPIPFHVAALAIHAVNSGLVLVILLHIVGDRLIAAAAACTYAASVAIHLDTLAWVVGIYDLGAAFFFFLALLLCIRDRPLLAAVAYLFGCLCKESVLVLPGILVFLPILTPGLSWSGMLRTAWRQCSYCMAVAIVFALLKLSSASALSLPDSHPYALRLFGPHVVKHALVYPEWMFQSIFPFLLVRQPVFQVIALVSGAALLRGAWIIFRNELFRHQRTTLLFLVIWLFVALLPVLFLPNHTYRYYATLSLPAFLAIFFILLRSISVCAGVDARGVTVATALVAIGLSALQSNRIYAQGIDQNLLSDGSNLLIAKASVVRAVHDGLLRELPQAPKGATILIGDADIWAFDGSSGPRFWYAQASLDCFSLSDLYSDQGRPYIDALGTNQVDRLTGAGHHRMFVQADRLFAYRLEHLTPGSLVLEQLDVRDLLSKRRGEDSLTPAPESVTRR